MTAAELNKALKFLKQNGIFMVLGPKYDHASGEHVKSFHENGLEITCDWGSLDFQGGSKVADIEHPNEEEYKDLI